MPSPSESRSSALPMPSSVDVVRPLHGVGHPVRVAVGVEGVVDAVAVRVDAGAVVPRRRQSRPSPSVSTSFGSVR
jgi:hypothetical protein